LYSGPQNKNTICDREDGRKQDATTGIIIGGKDYRDIQEMGQYISNTAGKPVPVQKK
jgi:hypothetical protein